MRIRAKINTLVGVLGAVALLTGATALYALHEYEQKLLGYQQVAQRVYIGEHVNRLVTAVVMEARGIYAASTSADAAQFAKSLKTAIAGIDDALSDWRAIVPADEAEQFEKLAGRAAEFKTFRLETARLGTDVNPAAASAQGNNEANRANRKVFQAEIDTIVKNDKDQLAFISRDIASFRRSIFWIVLAISGLGTVGGLAWGFYIASRQLSRPINAVTDAIKAVAAGDFNIDLPKTNGTDEIAEMTAAITVFKESGLENQRMHASETALRTKSDQLQAGIAAVVAGAAAGDFTTRITESYGDENLDRVAVNINTLLVGVDTGLQEIRRVMARLADGDLTDTMSGDFRGAFAEVQANVDNAFSTLRTAIHEVQDTTGTIAGGANELRSASDDLARRTEQQASALEETAAALDQITVVVQTSSERAQQASSMVSEANDHAARSGNVVRDAVDAMGRIEKASREISQIINVIDEIAFQTNLLALNAGVEAARAGEAGKGFAVVAQEVRELAQRSATAAKDIKTLITRSGDEVQSGVRLVQATGTALTEIGGRVNAINDHIHSIVTAAREQSTGLKEVSTAIGQTDKVTQQNAAMVEQTSAATHKLSADADRLASLVSRFRIAKGVTATKPVLAGHVQKPAASPARRAQQQVAHAFGTNKAAVQASWEEF